MAMTASLSMALAQSNSSTANVSAADEMIGWVSPDARRSTWDIIWSCLSIFLVCSWKCIHLNLPTPKESLGKWHKFPLWCWEVPYWPEAPLLVKWGRKLAWMGIISIAPEMGVALAVKQWLGARKTLKGARRDLDNANLRNENFRVDYSMAHAFYAKMGGIVVCTVKRPEVSGRLATKEVSHETKREIAPTEVPSPETPPTSAPIKHKQALVSPQEVKTPDEEKNISSSEKGAVAYQRVISQLIVLNDPSIVSTITEEDINDRSKADAFTKVFALVQSSWLVIQSIARVVRGLAISQLELATIAFVVCALVMYIFWWNKPFDAERRHTMIRLAESESEESEESNDSDYLVREEDRRVKDLTMMEFRELVLENDAIKKGDITRDWPTVALYLSGMAFSAIHLTAWNWEFPSPLVKALWRWFAMIAFVASFLPLVEFPAIKLFELFGLDDEGRWVNFVESVLYAIAWAMLVSYVISRLAILLLTFYCFTSMPASAYEKVEWTGFIPHFS